jgi:hypothetical protein
MLLNIYLENDITTAVEKQGSATYNQEILSGIFEAQVTCLTKMHVQCFHHSVLASEQFTILLAGSL